MGIVIENRVKGAKVLGDILEDALRGGTPIRLKRSSPRQYLSSLFFRWRMKYYLRSYKKQLEKEYGKEEVRLYHEMMGAFYLHGIKP